MLVLHPRISVWMDTKGVGPLSMVGVGVIDVSVMGVSVEVGWGDGVKVGVAPDSGGVRGMDGNVAVMGAARITGVGEWINGVDVGKSVGGGYGIG